MSLLQAAWHQTEIGPVKIEPFNDTYLKTETEIYWNDRFFRLDRYMTDLWFIEYEGEIEDAEVINTWKTKHPAAEMTGEEAWNWFFFLVVSEDSERLQAHRKKILEMLEK